MNLTIRENTKSSNQEERGTIKEAALRGDDECPELISASIYETNPVNFLSMTFQEVNLENKTKRVWDKVNNKMKNLKFLHLKLMNKTATWDMLISVSIFSY